MNKLQLLKICVLNLIFGAAIVAVDATEEVEPKRLRATVVRIDSDFKLPKGAIGVLVPRHKLIGLEETEEDGKESITIDRFSLAKAIRDSYVMSPEENDKLQSYIFAINENTMDQESMLLALNEAVENNRLGIVRLLSTYCPIEDVDVISGKSPKLGKIGSVKVIICGKEALGEKASLTKVLFRGRISKTKVKRSGFAAGRFTDGS